MISGDLIKEARQRAGLSQAELGRRIGQSQPVIARWERGRVEPSLETVRRLVAACGLELGFSLSRRDDDSDAVIEAHLQMTPAERFADLLARTRVREQRERLAAGNG